MKNNKQRSTARNIMLITVSIFVVIGACRFFACNAKQPSLGEADGYSARSPNGKYTAGLGLVENVTHGNKFYVISVQRYGVSEPILIKTIDPRSIGGYQPIGIRNIKWEANSKKVSIQLGDMIFDQTVD